MIQNFSKSVLLFLGLLLCVNIASAQYGHGGWLNFTHNQKLSSKFDLMSDFQFRSANDFDYLSTLLLRSTLSYNINKQHSVGLGYGNITDWEMINDVKTSKMEHRIFQQYMYKKTVENLRFNTRVRLEQRNLGSTEDFSQRLRFQVGAVIPLIANQEFTKGLYSLLQTEIMLNVQNKDNVNGSFYDQHRPYVAIGYRFSKKIDTEIGYLRWQQRKTSGDQERNIFQLRFLTNL